MEKGTDEGMSYPTINWRLERTGDCATRLWRIARLAGRSTAAR